ncbi:FHA domain-containing protein [bacterium]|nr:FHA domain-containing protein [bacterium]
MRTISIEDLRREAQNLGREQFLAKQTSPFLVLDQIPGADDNETFGTVDGRASAKRRPIELGAPSPRTRAVVVKKRDGANDFANMITIGRASNNDIALEVASVSKFHAYLTWDGPAWFLHDAGSSNGTWIDGERLGEAQGKAGLRDGTSIQLGPDARVRFFAPTALYELLTPKKHL